MATYSQTGRLNGLATICSLFHIFAIWAAVGSLSLAQTGSLLGQKSKQINLRYAEHLTEAFREYSQKAANMIEGEERSALVESLRLSLKCV